MATTKKKAPKPQHTRIVRKRGDKTGGSGLDPAVKKLYRLPIGLVELATALAVFDESLPIDERTQTGFVRQAILEKVQRSLVEVQKRRPLPDSVPPLLAKAKAAGYL